MEVTYNMYAKMHIAHGLPTSVELPQACSTFHTCSVECPISSKIQIESGNTVLAVALPVVAAPCPGWIGRPSNEVSCPCVIISMVLCYNGPAFTTTTAFSSSFFFSSSYAAAIAEAVGCSHAGTKSTARFQPSPAQPRSFAGFVTDLAYVSAVCMTVATPTTVPATLRPPSLQGDDSGGGQRSQA